MTFNLQYGKVISIIFCSRFLISNDFLLRNGKTQTNSFFCTTQIFGCLINTLSKYIRKICFNLRISKCSTAWKVCKYGVISGSYFPIFGLNTKIYSVNLTIQSKYRKIRTRNNSIYGHFSRSEVFYKKSKSYHDVAICVKNFQS